MAEHQLAAMPSVSPIVIRPISKCDTWPSKIDGRGWPG
jgi:hypothetical protein